MKTGFKDALKAHARPPHKPQDGKNTPWDYRQPEYDQRSSCFVNAGTHFGVGHKQPTGHAGDCKPYGVPLGKQNTMRIDEAG